MRQRFHDDNEGDLRAQSYGWFVKRTGSHGNIDSIQLADDEVSLPSGSYLPYFMFLSSTVHRCAKFSGWHCTWPNMSVERLLKAVLCSRRSSRSRLNIHFHLINVPYTHSCMLEWLNHGASGVSIWHSILRDGRTWPRLHSHLCIDDTSTFQTGYQFWSSTATGINLPINHVDISCLHEVNVSTFYLSWYTQLRPCTLTVLIPVKVVHVKERYGDNLVLAAVISYDEWDSPNLIGRRRRIL